jgi:soluble P-type ATPase
LRIETLVTDYSGTLSCGGKLTGGVEERLIRLAEVVDLHVLTSDTFGTARRELMNIDVTIKILEGDQHDVQKQRYALDRCDPSRTAALGNGANDRLLLQAVREAGGLGVAVDNGEGCATETAAAANLLIHGVANALDLLLEPDRLKATLRF